MNTRALVLSLSSILLLSGCGAGYFPIPAQDHPTQPPPTPGQSGAITIAPQYAAMGTGKTFHFQAGNPGAATLQWLVNGIRGGNSTVGQVDTDGNYTAPSIQQSENVTVTAALASAPATNFATAVASVIVPGVITSTRNQQVASYAIDLPLPGGVHIEFGPTTAYGFPTWVQSATGPNGGLIALFVAGMYAKTQYHMRAQVTLANGATYTGDDQTFTTGTPLFSAPVTASTQNGLTPQPGIEMFDTLRPYEQAQAFATDLSGNVLWTYSYPAPSDDLVQPIRLLPNGHFLVQISYASSLALDNPHLPPTTLDEVREIDLAGTTIRSITQAQLASRLAAQGYNLNLGSFHHEVLPLPNGHLLLLASVTKSFTDLPGYPGKKDVLGDVLIDVDQNLSPDWVWNSFDHLDINRHPYLFPDWTHSNALLYSADDHNLLLSVRHQNWIIKIDFEDGKGSGNILWRLGQGGDFKLLNATDPTGWFYAQHSPGFFSPNTTGVFQLGVMDNGDDRIFPSGVTCGAAGSITCQYTTVPILQIDEFARTATLLSDYAPQPAIYSFFGGNVESLPNGNLQVDFCDNPIGGALYGSLIQEIDTTSGTPRIAWQARMTSANAYRAERLPSLYPGVQW